MNLISDFWDKNRNDESCIKNVSLDIIVNHLKKIDGAQYTEILLEQNTSSLSVSGGNFGLYIINYYDSNDNSYLLKNDIKEDGEVMLVCGGQSAEFELKYCFKIGVVLNLLKDYFYEKDILSTYNWEMI
jgi:hypothetical protein